MSILIACVSSGKGTWIPVLQLIKAAKWEKVFIVTTPFFSDKLPKFEGVEAQVIVTDDRKSLLEMTDEIGKQLNLSFAVDVGVNLVSGSGKEHMAVISAVLKSGSGVRLVAANENGLVEV